MIPRLPPSPVDGFSADEAAAFWLVRLDAGALGAAEQAQFEAWQALSPRNAEALAHARAIDRLFDQADGDDHLAGLRTAALAARPASRRGRWIGLGAGIAASLLVAIGIATGSQHMFPSALPGARRPAIAARAGLEQASFATAKGERRRIRLDDGTLVTLDADSAIRVAYSPDRRLVRLTHGQALFEVAKNHAWPFTVHAGDRQVTALGTVFEVRLNPHQVKVVLVEGKVVVDGIKDRPTPGRPAIIPTLMRPGQELTASFDASQRLATVDIDQKLRWREGFVEFDDVRLAEAVEEMNRYSVRQIEIRDPGVAALRVSGLFRTGNVDRFAAIIGELLPVRATTLTTGQIALSASERPAELRSGS